MAYGGFIYLNKRILTDKILRDKVFNIVKDPKHDWYQRGLASMVYKFSHKKLLVALLKNGNISNNEISERITQTNY